MPNFPSTGGGPNSGPGLNPQTIYVAPNGNDGNTGRTESTAVRTGYVGYQRLQDVGGGRLSVASESLWGGPVPGQGCWIRGDGCAIDGWLQSVPSIIEGAGEVGSSLFSLPGKTFLRGGSNVQADYRTKPSIWLACNTVNIVNYRNLKPKITPGFEGLTGNYETLWGWRIGWDYPRNAVTGAIDYLSITNGSRTGGVSTFTVALPNPGIVVTSATRTSGTVRLTISAPGNKASFPPWNTGTWIYFASNDETNFPSGAFQVTQGASLEDSTTWSFSYAQAGADHTTASPGHVRTTQVLPGEYVDIENPATGWFSDQYKVISCTINNATTATLTVEDPYGGFNGTTANMPSTPMSNCRVVHQERGFGQVLQPDVYNCANWMPQAIPIYGGVLSGPGFDYGTCTAIPQKVVQCALQGYYPSPADNQPIVPDRQAAIFCFGGAEGMAALDMSGCTGSMVGIRYIASSKTSAVTIDNISDTGNGYHPPAYQADITAFVDFKVVRADVADAFISDTTPIINGSYDPSKITGTNLPKNIAGIMPVIGSGLNWQSGSYTDSPWAQGKSGYWSPELRLAARHPAGNRQISPVSARFKNLILPVASWTNTHGSMTTGQVDPMGGSNAVKLTDTGDGDMFATLRSGSDSDTSFAAGGTYVIAGWINFPDQNFNGTGLFVFDAAGGSDLVWATGGASWRIQCPAAIPGWQYVVIANKLVSGSASQSYSVEVNGPTNGSGKSGYLFGMSAFWIPPSVDKNDAAEFIGTLRAQPQYLPVGAAGTFESQPFYADGGLIVGKSGASGTVSMFDGATAGVSASGTGAFRYNAGTNKIQYSKNGGAWTDLV